MGSFEGAESTVVNKADRHGTESMLQGRWRHPTADDPESVRFLVYFIQYMYQNFVQYGTDKGR